LVVRKHRLLPVAASFGYLKSLSALPQIPAILVICGGTAPECQLEKWMAGAVAE